MSANFQIDLIANFATRCRSELQAAGYSVAVAPADDVIRGYSSVNHRRVSRWPRAVYNAAYVVPPDPIAGEHAFLKMVKSRADHRIVAKVDEVMALCIGPEVLYALLAEALAPVDAREMEPAD